jgi:ParB-like chromosome segregation protein Spo0J
MSAKAATNKQYEIALPAGKFVKTAKEFGGKPVYMVEILTIKREEFVRFALSNERVEHFEICLKSGDELPPIELTYEGVLIAGRHRIRAYEKLGHTTVPVVFEHCTDEDDLLIKAFEENYVKAPLPYSPADLAMIFRRQVDKGRTKKELEGMFVKMSKSQVAYYYERAVDTVNKRKVSQAIGLITEKGMTLDKAAQTVGVAPSLIQSALVTKSKKQALSKVAQMNQQLTAQFSANSRAVGKLMREALKEVEARTLKPSEFSAITKKWRDLLFLSTSNLKDFEERFDRLVQGQEIEEGK